MNSRHERIAALCESLNLPLVAQGYGARPQNAAKQDMGYSDFLTGRSLSPIASETELTAEFISIGP